MRWAAATTLALLVVSSKGARAEEPADEEYQTVIRTRSADEARPADDPATFSTVLRIKDPVPGVGLAELLERVPGLRVKDAGPGGRQSLCIRGAESHQVQIILDGVRLSSAGGGGLDLSLMDPSHLERVEVRRGGSSTRFGSSALGGVLVLRTPRLRTRARTKAAVGYGSFNLLAVRASRSATLRSWPNLRYLVSASYRQSEGDFPYVDSNGVERVRANNDARLGEGLVKLDYLFSERWQLRLLNSFSAAARGAPGMAEAPSDTGRQRDLRNLTSLTLVRSGFWFPESNLELGLYHRFSHFTFDQLVEPTIPEAHSRNSGFTVGGRARLELPLPGAGRLDSGAEIRGVIFRDSTTDNPWRLDVDLWASSQIPLLSRHLVLVPAFRLATATDLGATVVPRGGLVLRPLLWTGTKWLAALELASNVGRSYRLPSFQEMYIRLDGFGPNPELEPEDALEADVGLRWRSGLLTLEAAIFRRWIKNLILFAPVSLYLVRADNYPGARAQGAEASLDLRPGVGIRLRAAYTYTQTRFSEPVMSLPGHPEHRLVTRLGWRFPFNKSRTRPWSLQLWTAATMESSQVLYRFDTIQEEGRVLLSAGGAFSWRWLTLSAQGRNLLDKRDALDTVGFPVAPARFLVSVAASK